MSRTGARAARRRLRLGLVLACASAFGAAAEGADPNPRPTAPVVVFEAAKILTMEPSLPTARFVAVSQGTILGVADDLASLGAWTRDRPVELDRRFAGKVLMPGLIDPHVHPMQAAVMYNVPFLAPDDWDLPTGRYPGARTPEAYRERLRAMLAASDAQPFVVWGHHALFHGELDRAALDALAPDRPVVVWQRSFHEIIANTAALADWGLATEAAFDAAIAAAQADPAHARFAQGVFSETALPVAIDRLRPVLLAPDRMAKGFAALVRNLLTSGVTTVSDMGTGIFAPFAVEAGLIARAFGDPETPARIMLMPLAMNVAPEVDPVAMWADVERRHAAARVRVDRRVKLLADGAFFAQNMRMNPPGYSDGHVGKWITEPAVLRAQLLRFWAAGFDLHVHVNGDEGLDVVLAGVEALPRRPGQTVTLEHLGYSTEAQNRRIARLGLMVSAQPNYLRVLGDAYAERGLGPDRAALINRLGSLERKGVPLGLHSDFNMAPIDPFQLAWIAANRITVGGHERAPAERLSLDKALRAITIEAAQVIGMDALVGSIASGKKADFVVLDRDPTRGGAKRLREVRVEGVIFEGRYRAAR
ncbi:MAG: amidohydrolase family protein [Myxococcota bacterium]